jgi:hypothetical protein
MGGGHGGHGCVGVMVINLKCRYFHLSVPWQYCHHDIKMEQPAGCQSYAIRGNAYYRPKANLIAEL